MLFAMHAAAAAASWQDLGSLQLLKGQRKNTTAHIPICCRDDALMPVWRWSKLHRRGVGKNV